MKRFFKHLQSFIFPTLLVILVAILFWTNYVPGTWLSGWDTLHPEFNFALYLKRIFFGVWQPHQGVGALASQSHAGEFPHLVVLWLLSLILPDQILRYIFFFICLVAGVLGVYFLSKYLLQKKSDMYSKTASFLGAVFYVLNLTTVQQFSVPLEMFAIHFWVLPWLFYFLIRFVRNGEKTDLIWFLVTTFVSASSSHTPTLYYVYLVCLGLYLVSVWVISPTKITFKRSLLIFIATLLINSFWLLPNLYFVSGHSKEVAESKIHSVFSGEAFLQSQNYGNVYDLMLQKNFLFNWRAYDYTEGKFTALMSSWLTHLNDPGVLWLGYSLSLMAVIGILVAIYKRDKYTFSFLLPVFLCVVFWINANGPFTSVFEWFRNNSLLFREGLRFPFTKFSLFLVFGLSIFFASFAQFVFESFRKMKLSYLLAFLLFTGNIYYMLPAFKGNFVAKNVKVEIPSEYFQMFIWFNNVNPSARIAKFPVHTYWGWNYYSWGYEGAGFTWFGLTQPTLDREFDRWSSYNEEFYKQISISLFSGNLDTLLSTLYKYNVKYLLLDESVIVPGDENNDLGTPKLKEMIDKSIDITEVSRFNFLTIYEITGGNSDSDLIVPEKYIETKNDFGKSSTDPVFSKFGTYIKGEGGYLPFANLSEDVNIYLDGDEIIFENKLLGEVQRFSVDGATHEDLNVEEGFRTPYNCDLEKMGTVEKIRENGVIEYKAAGGGVSCDYLNYPDLQYRQAYVLRVVGENKKGRELKIYFYNHATKQMDLEELLPSGEFDKYYFIYPKDIDGSGYTLNFETRSYGKEASDNIVKAVEFYLVDYEKLVTSGGESFGERTPNDIEIIEYMTFGPWAYQAKMEGLGLVELDQGYEKGWVAVKLNGWNSKPDIYTHVKVNSWANGWIIDASNGPTTIYIVFWPQLLEWGGMIMGVLTFSWLVFRKKSD